MILGFTDAGKRGIPSGYMVRLTGCFTICLSLDMIASERTKQAQQNKKQIEKGEHNNGKERTSLTEVFKKRPRKL